jgi:hypothetical protein
MGLHKLSLLPKQPRCMIVTQKPMVGNVKPQNSCEADCLRHDAMFNYFHDKRGNFQCAAYWCDFLISKSDYARKNELDNSQ